jgi:polysaccharide biosynthesis transport protein
MIEPKPLAQDEVSLQQYLEIIRRRRWTIVNTIVAVLVLGCVATALMTPIYQAQAKLLVRATAPQISAMNTENPLVDLLAMAQPESVDTQMEVLRSDPFLDEVFRVSGAPHGKGEPHVRVTGLRNTNVIEVTVQSPDREMAARVANTMLSHYLERTRLLSLQEITQARVFVEKEARKARHELQRAEDTLLSFRRANRVAEQTAEQQNRAQELGDLEARHRETAINMRRLQSQMREVRHLLTQQGHERLVSIGQKNPGVDSLQSKLAEAQVDRATLLNSYQPGSPEVRAVEAQITSLQAQLAAEPLEQRIPLHLPNDRYDKLLDRLDTYQTELEGLQTQYAEIDARLEQKREHLNQLGPWEVRLAQMQRDREIAEKSYLNLVNKLQDLQIRENARRSTARIIESAQVPTDPIRPRPVLNLALALMIALCLGFCLAFLQEYLDDRITSAEEVDPLLGLPVMGYIPAIAGDRCLIDALPPHSPIVESYRALRSSISFSAVDRPLTTLGITSAHAREGKSTTAANLALAMAMDGRRVILVDADLRRPSLDRLLGLRPAPGLTDLLTGRCSLEDALQDVTGSFGGGTASSPIASLRVLTSGPIPPNPAEVLNTAGMENIIRQLREKADLVIFDTPPCVPITDAQVLGTRLDGVLFITELGQTHKAEARRGCELLGQAHIRVLGVVLNKMRGDHGGYYYRYGYYHQEPSGNSHRGRRLPAESAAHGNGTSRHRSGQSHLPPHGEEGARPCDP